LKYTTTLKNSKCFQISKRFFGEKTLSTLQSNINGGNHHGIVRWKFW